MEEHIAQRWQKEYKDGIQQMEMVTETKGD